MRVARYMHGQDERGPEFVAQLRLLVFARALDRDTDVADIRGRVGRVLDGGEVRRFLLFQVAA